MTDIIEETLNEYLDNALAPSARADVDAHIAVCVACAAELASLRSLFAAIESLPEVPLQRDLTFDVLAGIPSVRASASSLPRVVRWALLLQALVVVVSLALAWPLLDLSDLQVPIAPPDWSALARFMDSWRSWLAAFALPDFTKSFSLHLDPPALLLTLTLVSACLLWLVGNGLLLVLPRTASLKRRHS